jgi:hypothetical protein
MAPVLRLAQQIGSAMLGLAAGFALCDSLRWTEGPLDGFLAYVREIESVAVAALAGAEVHPSDPRLTDYLNGGPAACLERTVSLQQRKAQGAFFTSHSLGAQLFSLLPRRVATTTFWDPTCGAGDLLLAASSRLPIRRDLDATLRLWGSLLHGTDIEPGFVRAARARLVLSALSRGYRIARPISDSLQKIFPGLRVGDLLMSSSPPASITHIVLNPPFGEVLSPPNCEWGTGTVSAAAVFLDHVIAMAPIGTRVTAILPDVLRSGSRYTHWRSRIGAGARIHDVQIVGRFSPTVDVDVFLCRLTVTARPDDARPRASAAWTSRVLTPRGTIGDRFEIHVGAVVPHRDPEEGVLRAYLHARTASPGSEIRRIPERRRFRGRVFSPPLVVVRRTSSPSDASRAPASIVLGRRPVAVENHLLVLQPRHRTIAECRRALRVLAAPTADAYLNHRIRCRHLTVDAIRGIPWTE